MTWTTIRLELASSPAFPKGSVARSYVLRLPLGEDGVIDEPAYRAHPELATVRRFWPNEPDRHGSLLRTAEGWALAYAPGKEDDERLFYNRFIDKIRFIPKEFMTAKQKKKVMSRVLENFR